MAGGLFGGTAVAAGAFASHWLRDRLDDRALQIFETGARYQMYHALALVLVALLLRQMGGSVATLTTAALAFGVGNVLFSGSLYALALTGIKILGAIAPLGGLAHLVGWGCIALTAWNLEKL